MQTCTDHVSDPKIQNQPKMYVQHKCALHEHENATEQNFFFFNFGKSHKFGESKLGFLIRYTFSYYMKVSSSLSFSSQ